MNSFILIQFQRSPLGRLFLFPLECIYRYVITLRNYLYDKSYIKSYKSKLCVISIGNVHAGGTGKTPLVIALANNFREQDYSPVIIIRGYKAKLSSAEPLLVSKNHSSVEVGDEALELFLSTKCPVVLCTDRVNATRYVESEKLGDIILLDDALQHRRIERSVNITVVPAEEDLLLKDFESDVLLPRGLLREPVEQALKRTEILCVTCRSGTCKRGIERIDSTLDRYKFAGYVRKLHYMPTLAEYVIADIQQTNLSVAAYSGIGRSEHFFEYLRSVLQRDIYTIPLPDHGVISSEQLSSLISQYGVVITTRKDWVKLSPSLQERVFVVDLEIHQDSYKSVFALVRELLGQDASKTIVYDNRD